MDFNLNIRPGVNFYAPIALSKINGAEDFPSTVSFRAGIEAEVIFPFNKYKWSVIFEPNYSSYSTKKVNTPVENGLYNMSFDSYSFINLPIGIRHYMYISDKSSVFVNASISLLTLKTGKAENIELDYNGNIYDSFPLSKSLSAKSLGFGVGFNYNKKYMAEFRVNTKYNILDKSRTPEADLSYFTFIVGYNLF
ncbi:outer membrane beta-barrel protein [Chryseobacterium sp.]|uniref:outer membrane beta-barrel protein n=1 Tax=Chryseobacterium sp. TaxID=1871047 RepID=UPI0028A21F7F|nr:outer membrane beta-barrel protein [Chryseobacterium sp.]